MSQLARMPASLYECELVRAEDHDKSMPHMHRVGILQAAEDLD